jgi:hypothetical protein
MNKPLPQDRPAKRKMIAERLFLRQPRLLVGPSSSNVEVEHRSSSRPLRWRARARRWWGHCQYVPHKDRQAKQTTV